MRHRQIVVIALSLLTLASAAHAQTPPCSAPEHRQFDFWLGDWEVRTPDGRLAGTNLVTRELGDCVLHEHWKGAGGMSGESFNAYDAARRRWHQTWVSDRGAVLTLDGAFDGTRMVLSGARPDTSAAGGAALQRITWTPLEGGAVRQLWETSKDGGRAWTVVFDGRYTRKPGPR